jgi:hypothetical protein
MSRRKKEEEEKLRIEDGRSRIVNEMRKAGTARV